MLFDKPLLQEGQMGTCSSSLLALEGSATDGAVASAERAGAEEDDDDVGKVNLTGLSVFRLGQDK